MQTLLAQPVYTGCHLGLVTAAEAELEHRVQLLEPEGVQRRFHEFCVLNARAFAPQGQRWSLDHRGAQRDSPFFKPWENSYSYFTHFAGPEFDASDFFICTRDSGSLTAFQLGRVVDEELIHSHGYCPFGLRPGDYYQVLIVTDNMSQRHGYGTALVQAMMHHAPLRGCRRIWTRCAVANKPVLGLMERKFGFRRKATMTVDIAGTTTERALLYHEL